MGTKYEVNESTGEILTEDGIDKKTSGILKIGATNASDIHMGKSGGANPVTIKAPVILEDDLSDAGGNYALFQNLGRAVFGNNSVNASAQLEVVSTSRGFLPPRMTTTQRDAITSPAEGLTIWNTTTNSLNSYDGTSWTEHATDVISGTHTTNWTGIWASAQAGNLTYTRVSNVVTLMFPAVLATANTATTVANTVALPTNLRPSSNVDHAVRIRNNATDTYGIANIATDGFIKFGVGAPISNYLGSGDSGFHGTSISYLV